jgi:hypothetical protein
MTKFQIIQHEEKLLGVEQRFAEERTLLQQQLQCATSEMSALAIQFDNAKYSETAGLSLQLLGNQLDEVKQRVRMLQTRLSQCSAATAKSLVLPMTNPNANSIAKLEEWLELSDGRFEGKVYGKPGFVDGKTTRTSRVLQSGHINIENGYVQTKSKTKYLLGSRFAGPVVDSFRETAEGGFEGKAWGFPNNSMGSMVVIHSVPMESRHGNVIITNSGIKLQLGTPAGQDVGWQVRLVSEDGSIVISLATGFQRIGRGQVTGVIDMGCDVGQIESKCSNLTANLIFLKIIRTNLFILPCEIFLSLCKPDKILC